MDGFSIGSTGIITFKHPEHNVIITVTHPRKDLPLGLVRRIYKLAGWRP